MLNKIKNIFDYIVKDEALSLIIVFILMVFSRVNIFVNNFVMDDMDFIVSWPLIQDLANWPSFFINYIPPAGQEGIYSPLKTLVHAIFYNLFGLNPLGYHIVSLLIHGSGIYFVYKIIDRLTGNKTIGFVSTVIFAVHPVQVEAITYMTASVDMVGIVFLFGAFYFLMLSVDEAGRKNVVYYMVSMFLGVLAVFTHELAISIPLLFLWYLFCYSKDSYKKIFLRTLPFLAIVLIYVLCKILALGGITRGEYVGGSFYLTMLIAIKALFKYIVICFFPFVLTHNHIISSGISSFGQDDFDKYKVMAQSIFDLNTFIPFLMLLSLVALAVIYYRKNRLISFAIGWYFLALLPVSNIIPSGVLFGERYLYPGLLGFALMVGVLFDYAYNKNKIYAISLIVLLITTGFYVVRTLIRNADWKNEIALMESAVKANPQSALMRNDLGLIYTKNSRNEDALKSFKEALFRRSDDPVTYFSMAESYIQLKQYKNAIDSLEAAIKYNPEYAEAYYNLASIYAVWKMNDKALENLNKALIFYEKSGKKNEGEKLKKAFFSYYKDLNGD